GTRRVGRRRREPIANPRSDAPAQGGRRPRRDRGAPASGAAEGDRQVQELRIEAPCSSAFYAYLALALLDARRPGRNSESGRLRRTAAVTATYRPISSPSRSSNAL